MQTLQSISKRILAALSMFTRLPLWRLCNIDRRYYERVVSLWPLAGWLTGGVMAAVFYLSTLAHLSVGVAIVLALLSRVLLTGALHEDGFADFCDGFGGGTSRQRILEIMKDSHNGTYGVLGLVLYYLLMWNMLVAAMAQLSPLTFVIADAGCKFISSTIICFLPYARKQDEAKIQLLYTRSSIAELLVSLVLGLLPLLLFFDVTFLLPLLASFLSALLLFAYMYRRIGGYTGDCCGATFIIIEAIFYLILCISLS